MTGQVKRATLPGAVGENRERIRKLERARPCGPWVPADLINSWANVGAPFYDMAYRLCLGDVLNFRGRITGGVSGTVAFVLDPLYWPDMDLPTITDTDDGVLLGAAQIYVAAADGSVTVTEIP